MTTAIKVSKNNKIHIEGQTNVRASRTSCPHCNEPIKRGDGYKLITEGTYFFCHNNDTCIKGSKSKAYVSKKEYAHGLQFNVIVTIDNVSGTYLQSLDLGSYKFNKCGATGYRASIKSTTRNDMKGLKALDGMVYSVSLKIHDTKTDNRYDIKFKASQYQELSDMIAYVSHIELNTYIGTYE